MQPKHWLEPGNRVLDFLFCLLLIGVQLFVDWTCDPLAGLADPVRYTLLALVAIACGLLATVLADGVKRMMNHA